MCGRCLELTRRSLLAGGGAAVAALHAGAANARVRPVDMVPLVGPGFKPTDKDEQGLWEEMDRVEEEIAGSNLLVDDPKLSAYLRDLIGTVGGPAAKDMRIYVLRVPEFNAMMFPSGFAVVSRNSRSRPSTRRSSWVRRDSASYQSAMPYRRSISVHPPGRRGPAASRRCP